MTQFEIVAEINQWDGADKATFLATSPRGLALTVLSNLPSESRIYYPSLIAALENRFGNKRQTELHRMKLRNRVKRRDECYNMHGVLCAVFRTRMCASLALSGVL